MALSTIRTDDSAIQQACRAGPHLALDAGTVRQDACVVLRWLEFFGVAAYQLVALVACKSQVGRIDVDKTKLCVLQGHGIG